MTFATHSRLRHTIQAGAMTSTLAAVLVSGAAAAATCPAPNSNDIFTLTLCVDGEVRTAGTNSIADVIDIISNESLDARFPNYDEDTSPGEFRLDVRGLPAILSYDQDSTKLVFNVPSLGINETFDAGTRDASNDEFEDYLKDNGDDILRELLRVSPIDPLAGNPASLQSEMVAGAFAAGVDPTYDTLAQGSSFGIGARFGLYSAGDYNQDVFTLPLSYAYTFKNYDKLIVTLPITYIDVDGAAAYRGNLGVAYKKNIFRRWAVTPSIGYGITGSSDLGSLGHIFSVAVTSDLMLIDKPKFQLSMGNMAGYYWTLPVRAGDYGVDYDLTNTILRNGLLLSLPWQKRIWGRDFSLDIYVTDTRFFGDELYSDNYQEIGVTFGPMRSGDKLAPNTSSHPFGIGLKYVTGDGDIDGFELNFGYRF